MRTRTRPVPRLHAGIVRADDRISFADLADPFEKLRLLARRQVHFAVDDVVDGGQNVLNFAGLEHGGNIDAVTVLSPSFLPLPFSSAFSQPWPQPPLPLPS
jgi:hypothetical protein